VRKFTLLLVVLASAVAGLTVWRRPRVSRSALEGPRSTLEAPRSPLDVPRFAFRVSFEADAPSFLDEGRLLLVRARHAPRACTFSLETGERVSDFQTPGADWGAYGALHDDTVAFDDGHELVLVSGRTGQARGRIPAHERNPAPAFAADADLIGIASREGVSIYSTSDGSLRAKLAWPTVPSLPHDPDMNHTCALSPSGRVLAALVEGASCCVLATRDGSVAAVVSAQHAQFLTEDEILASPPRIVGQVLDVQVLAARDGHVLRSFRLSPDQMLVGGMRTLEFLPYQADDVPVEIRIRSLETGAILCRFQASSRSHVTLSPRGDRVASTFPDGRVEVRDVPP
jgi:hypothetical protein